LRTDYAIPLFAEAAAKGDDDAKGKQQEIAIALATVA
jgi:hypothetical protein